MNIPKNEETSDLLAIFVIKMKQLCCVSLRKRIKTNHEVKKKTVKSTQKMHIQTEETTEHVEPQGVIKDVETEVVMNNSDFHVNDGNIFDILNFCKD